LTATTIWGTFPVHTTHKSRMAARRSGRHKFEQGLRFTCGHVSDLAVIEYLDVRVALHLGRQNAVSLKPPVAIVRYRCGM
jgi:hypothetical protein